MLGSSIVGLCLVAEYASIRAWTASSRTTAVMMNGLFEQRRSKTPSLGAEILSDAEEEKPISADPALLDGS
jgi:hypothetical protein